MGGDAVIDQLGNVTLTNGATTRSHLGLGTTNSVQFANVIMSDPTTNSKQVTWNLANQSASTTITFNIGAQTASRTIAIPVLTGNDSFAMMGFGNTFTGTNLFSGALQVSNNSGLASKGSAAAALATSAQVNFLRSGGVGLAPVGSAVIQTDPGQAGAGVYFVAGTTGATIASIDSAGTLSATGALCAKPVTVTLTNGGSATGASSTYTEIDLSTGTLGSAVFWLPATAYDGQMFHLVKPAGTITGMTVSGNGHTLVGTASGTFGPGPVTWDFTYYNATASWYRGQ
jgi:hypothetical protein